MDINFFGLKINVGLLTLICVIYLVLVGHLSLGCCSFNCGAEGFTGANTNYGLSSPYSITKPAAPIDSNKWNMPDMVIQKGKPMPSGVKQILNRPTQPIPLPDGEMLMFANTEFKGECCPNAYSSSEGCACMTTGQYNYLITRGGNNVPYSEY
jgi:hypothetical protein